MMLTLYRPLESQSSAGWGQAELMGPGLQSNMERQLSRAVESGRNFIELFPKPFLGIFCVPDTGLLASKPNRVPMKGSP